MSTALRGGCGGWGKRPGWLQRPERHCLLACERNNRVRAAVEGRCDALPAGVLGSQTMPRRQRPVPGCGACDAPSH